MQAKRTERAEEALKALEGLSHEELMTLAARAAAARRAAEKAGKKPPKKVKLKEGATDWTRVRHTCPKCGHEGPVDPDFGVRVVRGVERRQSWCATCRSTTSYYSKPRKNLVR